MSYVTSAESLSTEARQLTREDTLFSFGGDTLSTDVFLKKYAVTRKDGTLEEYLPSQMWRRMARAAASVEDNSNYWEEKFYNILEDWKAVPQGSIMFALGNPYQRSSCSNCFVVPIQEDSLDGIFNSAKEMAKTYAYRGGVGIDISPLRPDGAAVSNAARTSTGAWSYMDFYSYVTRLIGQHGRRGALMLTIDDNHPDVIKFITAKTDLTKVTGANISIKISDDFMKCLEKGETWTMSFTTTHETISKQVPASEIWDLIIKCATETAEPGILFWDTILRESPSDCYAEDGFRTICTNPCCFSVEDNIQVLTQEGFKEIKEVTCFDKIWIDSEQCWAETSGYFDAGIAETYEVTLSNGTRFRVTENHKFEKLSLERTGTKARYTKNQLLPLHELKIGDRIATHINQVTGFKFGNCGTYEEGLTLGWLAGDGTLCYHDEKAIYPDTILQFWQDEYDFGQELADQFEKWGYECSPDFVKNNDNDVFRIRSARFTKDITEKYGLNIWQFRRNGRIDFLNQASEDFIRGFLRAYFTADGTVQHNPKQSRFNIQLASINQDRLFQVRDMLLLFGISSSVVKMRDGGLRKFNNIEYETKDCYRLTITNLSNLIRFEDEIGFVSEQKADKLSSIIERTSDDFIDRARGWTKIVSIDSAGISNVGCIEVFGHHKFTANGIISGNSEIPLPAYDACTLLSMNLTRYVIDRFLDSSRFDYDKFAEDTEIAVRFLDNVKEIDLSLMPLQEQKDVARKGRRIGIGTNGLGDTLANLGIRYDSDEAIDFVDKLFEFFAKTVYGASVKLAEEKGAFPIFDAEKEKDNPFLNRIGFAGIPRRNIACLTCAPTGSLSTLCQTSSGVEPVFRNSYIRRRKINHNEALSILPQNLYKDSLGDTWEVYTIIHHNVNNFAKEVLGVDLFAISNHEDRKKAFESIQDKLPDYFVESDTIDWEKRVQIQSTMQKWIDHAISSTCNLPRGTTTDTVKKVYEAAYRAGCKGFTVYVDGCREGVLVTETKENNNIQKSHAPKRPKTLNADVYHINKNGESYFAMVGLLNGDPYEIFAGKNGFMDKKVKSAEITKVKRGHYSAVLDNGQVVDNIADHITDEEAAITRLISLSLRHGADIKYCVDVLQRVPGDMNNFARVLSRSIKHYVPDGTVNSSISEDGKTWIHEEGCLRCLETGESKCM